MLYEKIKDVISGTFGVIGFVVLVAVLLLIFPAIAIWVTNSLAESADVAFRLEHNLWNYFLVLIVLLLIRGW